MLITSHIPSFDAVRVIVYGDLMLDRYWYGNTSRISPEAPVPVVHIQESRVRPGGAANVALNIAALGANAILFGLVGDDPEAKQLTSALENELVQCQFLTVPNHPTITKLRVMGQNQHQQLLRMDFEKRFHQFDDVTLQCTYREHLRDAQVVVLSDYAKGAIQSPRELIQMARAQGVAVLVDPKSVDFSIYAGADLVTPNFKEFEAVVGPCPDQNTLFTKAKTLLADCNFGALLITQGRAGMTLVTQQGEMMHYPAHAHEVFDVTGAGDTVIAVTAAVLAAGKELSDAVQLANFAAGIVVTKLGAETVSVAELRRAAQRYGGMVDSGILTEEELMIVVADARAHDETIVMTNGCFDILHAGHVQYLEQAKALGKRLVVAVNDDASVVRLKGQNRPLNRLEDRMAVLSALRAVDWVVPFSEDTPARLIEAIAPDVLVKGADYQVHQIAGAESVLRRGGKVSLLDFKPGFSTTKIIEKMKEVAL